MGCYGIGLGRIMASVVEQNNDDKGILWPINIAPFKVGIVLIDKNDELQNKISNELYEELTSIGIETILDDRVDRAGVKFNDMDLIGIPIRITIGKKINDDILELKLRENDEIITLNKKEVIEKIKELVK